MNPLAPTIYIAGSSQDMPRAKAAMHAAVGIGFRVLLDWTAAVEIEMAKGRSDKDLEQSERIHYATRDITAAASADVFWLLTPSTTVHSIGAWIEFGAALMSARVRRGLYGDQIVICSDTNVGSPKFSIFHSLALLHFKNDTQAIEWLTRIPVQRACELERMRVEALGFERAVLIEADDVEAH